MTTLQLPPEISKPLQEILDLTAILIKKGTELTPEDMPVFNTYGELDDITLIMQGIVDNKGQGLIKKLIDLGDITKRLGDKFCDAEHDEERFYDFVRTCDIIQSDIKYKDRWGNPPLIASLYPFLTQNQDAGEATVYEAIASHQGIMEAIQQSKKVQEDRGFVRDLTTALRDGISAEGFKSFVDRLSERFGLSHQKGWIGRTARPDEPSTSPGRQ